MKISQRQKRKKVRKRVAKIKDKKREWEHEKRETERRQRQRAMHKNIITETINFKDYVNLLFISWMIPLHYRNDEKQVSIKITQNLGISFDAENCNDVQ